LSAQNDAGEPIESDVIKVPGTKPKALKLSPPIYPLQMARAGLIGKVKVTFVIDQEGKVQNAYVLESNNPWFERPAIDAVLTWKFQPAEVDGRRVKTRAEQVIEFNLFPGGRPP